MKKYFLLLMAILLFIPVSGQFRIGMQGGFTLSTLIERNYNHDYASNFYKPGFHAGPVAEFAPGDHFSVKTALVLMTKGTQGKILLDTLNADVGTSLLYLDIPLLFTGSIKTGKFILFLQAGPYAGIGLWGKWTAETPDQSISRDIEWGSGTDDEFKRMDLGIMAGGGVEWNNFFLEGSFGFGLANIFPVREIDYDIHHRFFCLGLGYFFHR
jgi:hypothetical protein